MKRHIILIAVRLIFAFLISGALVFSHVHWGGTNPDDGQQAFGFVVMFTMVGFAAGILYLAVGCTVHAILRKKKLKPIVITDVVLAFVLIGLLTAAGITAHYEDTEPNQQVESMRR